MDYKHFSDIQLQDIYDFYQSNLPKESLPLDFFLHKTIEAPDYDPELSIAALDNGKIVGAMLGASWKTDDGANGGIRFFAVDKDYEGQKIASTMLERVENALRMRDVKKVTIGMTRPNYITPGIDPREYTKAVGFLLRRGYTKRGEPYNMDVDLASSDWSTDSLEARLKERGITGRRLGVDEKDRMRDYMKKNGHSDGWTYQVMHAAEADPVGVFIAEQDGEIIAFACYDGVRPRWFGPMGTRGDIQGGGVGTLTWLMCLQSMKAVGYAICEINSVGPLYFYSKTSNAKVSRIFWRLEKDL